MHLILGHPMDARAEVPVEGWYAEGSTVELDAGSPQGFLIRKVFKKWSGDVYSRSPSVTLVMNRARSVVAEWSTDYSQAYIVGGLSAALVVGGGYVSIRRRRRAEKAWVEAERLDREAQEAVELRKRVIGLVEMSSDVVVFEDMARGLNVSEDEVRAVIEEAVGGGVLTGRYSNDGRTFIPDDVFRRILKDQLKDE